jgi:hypothetical protein
MAVSQTLAQLNSKDCMYTYTAIFVTLLTTYLHRVQYRKLYETSSEVNHHQIVTQIITSSLQSY